MEKYQDRRCDAGKIDKFSFSGKEVYPCRKEICPYGIGKHIRGYDDEEFLICPSKGFIPKKLYFIKKF